MESANDEKKPLLRSSSHSSSERISATPLKTYGSSGALPGIGPKQNGKVSPTTGLENVKRPKKGYRFTDVFRYSTCCDYLLMFFGLLFSIIHGAGFPVLSIVFGGMTDTFLRAQVSNTSGRNVINQFQAAGMTNSQIRAIDNATTTRVLPAISNEEFVDDIVEYSVYYSLIGAAMLVTSYAQIACFQSSAERQIVRIRNAFFHSVLRQEIAWYDRHQSGELTSRLSDDLERIREGIGDKVTVFVQNVAAFASGFVIGFFYNWKLTLVMMSMTPVLAVSGAFVGKMMASATKREQEKYALAGGVADEVISCIRTVMALNGQRREIQRYKVALQAGKTIAIKKYLYSGLGLFVTFMATFASYALAFWYGSLLIDSEPNFSPGTVFTVFFAVMGGSMALGNAAPHFSSVVTAKGAATTIFEIIDNVPPIDPYCVGGSKPDIVNGKIVFRDVRFAYPTRKDVTVLNDITLTVNPGQNVAIVGASGCGKSTIINLLLRFYDCDKGEVTIDGYNVKHLNVHWLRGMIGVVSQEPVLFDGTIEENIRMGNLYASKEQVLEAAKTANALQFISTLPQGLNTRVGERGVQLSGGQKQRIAVARALVRDPKILLLDEATSALDAESEDIVQAALSKAQQGRTTITIAHRLSTIKGSDWIYVLGYGCVVEQGTHHDLMEKRQVYYTMVMNQQLEECNGGYEAETEDQGGPRVAQAISSGTEGATSEPRLLTRRLSSVRRRRGRTSYSGHRSDSEYGARYGRPRLSDSDIGSRSTQAQSRKSSQEPDHKSPTHPFVLATNEPLTRLESCDISRIEEEMEEEKVKPASITNIYKESRPEFGLMAIGGIGTLLTAAVMPAFAIFFSEIFNAFSLKGEELRKQSLLWSMMFLVLGAMQGFGLLIAFYFFGRAGENLTMNLRLKVFSNILRQDASYFDEEKHSTGKICTRLATDAPNVRAAMGTRVSFLISAPISMITGIIIAFIFGWKLALVITAITPLVIIASYLDLRLSMNSHKRDTSLLEEAGKTASQALSNIRTVQALCREHHFYITYVNHLKNPFKEAVKQAQLYALGFGVAQSVPFFMYAASFRYGGYLIGIGEIEPINVFRIFFAISFCAQSIGQASSFIPDLVKAKMSAGLLFSMMNHQPTIDNCSAAGIIPESSQGDLAVSEVYFNYPTRPTLPVLQNLSMNVQPGKTLALVGPSGCGKSTVVSLIERYYDPLSGEIRIDGYDLRTLNLPTARSIMALVSQEPVLFDCTIWENIAYGLEGKINHEQVVNAAKMANIHDFILSLPEGYQTKVGEKGTQLSGGQKQRIAIARALVRGPKILLLDEATSALDTESERVVQEALDRARQGRTCVMIAHRLSTVQSADCIAVVQDGRIVEKGTHAELIVAKGIYSKMTNMQNLLDNA